MPLSAGMTKLNLSLFTAVLLASPLASAEPFVQITPGVGVAATAAKLPGGSNVSLSGIGGTFDLEVGRSFGRNFIIAGDISATSVVGPTFKKDDMDVKIDKNIGWSTAFF